MRIDAQALSSDGGETFGPARYVRNQPQPLNGCEGSLVRLANATLFLSSPNSYGERTHLALWRSDDEGEGLVVAH